MALSILYFHEKILQGCSYGQFFALITSKLPGILDKNNLLLELGKEFLLLTTVVTSALDLQFVMSYGELRNKTALVQGHLSQ